MRRVLLAIAVLMFMAAPLRAAEPPERHVVLISVDGLAAFLLDDPQATLPNIRQLAREGAFAPQGMGVSNPSVTWPNHTSLVSGVHPERHGVLFNGVAERKGPGLPVQVDPRRDQQDLAHVPLLFDVFKKSGLTSAAINWPCTRGSTSLEDNFPDVPEAIDHSTPRLLDELVAEGILSQEQRQGFARVNILVRDDIWTNAACHLLRKRKPAFLCLHLLNVDSVHHRYGPQTQAGYSAVAAADAMVGRVLRTLDETGLRERTTVIIVSDHGFASIPKTIQPNVALRRAGLLTVENSRIASARAHVIPEGGIGMLYLTVRETKDEDRKRVLELFRNAEGIEQILEPADFAKYRLPHPDDNPRMADLILVGKDGYGFSATATGDELVVPSTGTLGTHGFLSTWGRMNATFVASGAGIRTGATVSKMENIDVAPTIAKLLGIELPHADGRLLSEILK